jgi:hypothetical protein
MYTEIKRVCRRFLTTIYEKAHAAKEIIQSKRVCVRSFTPKDQELCCQVMTANNGVAILEGGGSTGTTTKAPFRAVTTLECFKRKDRAQFIQPPVLLLLEACTPEVCKLHSYLHRMGKNQ